MIVPVFNLFFIGSKLNKEGKQLYLSNLLCSTYLNAIINQDKKRLAELDEMEDKEVIGYYSLESLGIEDCYKGFKRKVLIKAFEESKLYLIQVAVTWQTKNGTKTYLLKTLVEKS